MEPKKKSAMDYLIPILCVIFALYIDLMLAASYDSVKTIHNQMLIEKEKSGEILTRKDMAYPYTDLFNDFSDRIKNHPSEIQWSKSTPKFILITVIILGAIAGYFYTEKKNFISGKEYGTSRWGTAKELAHLRAENILKTELKTIKKKKGGKKEQEEAKLKFAESSNSIFTQTEKICMYNFELNNNVMIIGGSGSGKTRGYVLPNILQCCNNPYSPSIVVTDPKGEILQKIGKYLEQNGYVIKVLNLKEQNRSFCFNPFCYILEEKYEEQISNLVASIMSSRDEKKEQKSNDPFWEEMAQVLLKAIFYATYEGFPPEEQNLPTVMELFRWFEVSDNDDRYNNPTKLDKFFDVFGDKNGLYDTVESILDFYKKYYNECAETTKVQSSLNLQYKTMRENLAIPLGSECSTVIDQYEQEIKMLVETAEEAGVLTSDLRDLAQSALQDIEEYKSARANNYEGHKKPIGVHMYEIYGDVNTNPALRSWEDFRTKCKGKTAQSVTATALAKLAPFDEAQIRRIFSKDEMELDLIGERRTALFIILPPTNTNYNFMANVLYTMLFEQLEYCATVKHDQVLPVPVKFILDEFYNTGRIPKFENILSYARSFGIGITIILQSLDQIKEMYEKSWGTVLDNCSAFLYLGGIRHEDTLKYISSLLGKGTFDKKTYSRTKGRQSSSSTSFDKIGRELLDPSEIQRINKKKCLLFISGYQPYFSKKFDYKTHKNYQFTSDANKKNIYVYKTPQDDDREAEEKSKSSCEKTEDEVMEIKPISIPPILIPPITPKSDIQPSYDFEKNFNTLQETFLSLAVVSERASLITDEEIEKEMELLLKEEAEVVAQNNEMIAKLVHKKPITVQDTEEEVRKALEKLQENPEHIEIIGYEDDVEEEEGTVYLNDDDDREYIEDLESMDRLLKEVMSLTDEALTTGFMQNLADFDMSNLEAGRMQSNDEEETEEK